MCTDPEFLSLLLRKIHAGETVTSGDVVTMRAASGVVPRAMLLEKVWDLHFDPMTNVIDVYVGRLRRKIDRGYDYPLIHTVRGVGFCLRAPG